MAKPEPIKLGCSQRNLDLINRIFKRCELVDRGYITPCYEWQGANSGYGRGGGYGKVSVDGHKELVHRVIWACFNGFISKNRQVDHLCNNRACCNPHHLDYVTNNENQRRKNIVMERLSKELRGG